MYVDEFGGLALGDIFAINFSECQEKKKAQHDGAVHFPRGFIERSETFLVA